MVDTAIILTRTISNRYPAVFMAPGGGERYATRKDFNGRFQHKVLNVMLIVQWRINVCTRLLSSSSRLLLLLFTTMPFSPLDLTLTPHLLNNIAPEDVIKNKRSEN